MGCPKIVYDVDFYDMDDDRVSRQMRVLVNTHSEQRRRTTERAAKEAEKTARIEARAERERKQDRDRNAVHSVVSALFIGGLFWAASAGLIAPVIAFPAVCIGFAYFGGRVANTVRLCKGRERR
jgi:hypothetical protein